MKVSELVFFLTQLSTYIKSGIPLVDSVKILSKQTKKASVQTLYKAIIYDLTMGDNFSEALEKQGESFPKLLVNMVKSAELSGNLSETLDDMAEYYSSVSKTRKQMKSAMTYPTVIFIFAMTVVVFLLVFVIPSFVDMYRDADAEVPTLTLTIIAISDFLINNALLLILGFVGLIVGFYFMYKNVKLFRSIMQWILMHTPIVGKIIIYNEVTMFSKTFASLWNHNVFITSSMEILSKITNNEIYKMLIFDAITNIARGEPVSSSFKNHWAFPIVAYEMLLTGERTGQPGPMMGKVADYYQEEHKNAVNQVKTFIEPAMIVFLAVVVGAILLSVVLPMFGIYGEMGLE
jgi:type IV pilus assembly protein PilC